MDKKDVVYIDNGVLLLLLLLSRFSRVRLCVTPWTAAYQAPPSVGFSRREHWSGLPFPSPMHESGKWKWSCSVVSDSLRPHGLQPTRLLHPWDFLGNSTGVGCHCLLHNEILLSHKKEWNNAICSNMGGLREYWTKWNKSDRERQISYDITYMWNLKNNKYQFIYKT